MTPKTKRKPRLSLNKSVKSPPSASASRGPSPSRGPSASRGFGALTRSKSKQVADASAAYAAYAAYAIASPPKKKIRITVRRPKKSVSPQKSAAATKVINFIRKSNYLLTKCPNASSCLALDTYATDIKKHFKGFTAFDYATTIEQLGQQSNNGFIKKITYEHKDYSAYAILKSSQTPEADNLMYEYIVGQYINKLNKHFSCFVETYGYYIYKDAVNWLEMKDLNRIDVLKNNLIHQDNTNFEEACLKSQYLAILIQYLSEVKSLYDMVSNPAFVANDLLGCLFQLYMPLAAVKDTFTHYDLHLDNIQIYQPKQGHYIHYHYQLPMGVVLSFKSSYMTKIIDYGRCYFNDITTGMNSKTIFDEVCGAYNCGLRKNTEDEDEDEDDEDEDEEDDEDAADAEDADEEYDEEECGKRKGFTWLRDEKDPASAHYIIAQKKNISHDLLPLMRLKERKCTKYLRSNSPIKKIIDGLLTAVSYNPIDAERAADMGSFYFGTPELLNSGLPRKINNVQDAFEKLVVALSSRVVMEKNERDYAADKATKMGDLMIYADGRPMVYVPV